MVVKLYDDMVKIKKNMFDSSRPMILKRVGRSIFLENYNAFKCKIVCCTSEFYIIFVAFCLTGQAGYPVIFD